MAELPESAESPALPDRPGDVAAILVTYNPDALQLRMAIRALLGQVAHIFIVDNASSNASAHWLAGCDSAQAGTQLHFLPQNDNHGIGAAHNIGIQAALAHRMAYVLLLDQDSIVAPDMVHQLRSAHLRLRAQGQQVAALGPRYRSAESESATLSDFVRVGLLRFTHHGCDAGQDTPGSDEDAHDASTDTGTDADALTATKVIAADFLVSSGSLIPVDALATIGMMDASLFIDHVDTEWCLRARSAGWHIYGVCSAVMTHTLGENRRKVWFLRWRNVPFHQPFRYYYMFRNSVLLYRRGYMPWRWKLADFVRCLKMWLFFALMSPNRLNCLHMMGLGVLDGLQNRHGRRDDLLRNK